MNDATQLSLHGIADPLQSVPLSLQPINDREEPAVWISKLAVYKSWPPTQDSLLRQIFELRRGLNILWAKPTGATGEASRLAGHGAGKTTFCRLLRYVLGEEPAGSKSFREGFRANFENGWVLAEVFVGGIQWLVGRPLSNTGYHSFAKQGGSLADEFPDSPSKSGFKEDYLAAIDAAVFGKMKFRTLADSQELLDWPRLLPWLSRDQEAHFSGLLEWRHKDSDHDSPYVSHEDKANLIRLILGLVDKEEQDLLSLFAQKAELHEQKVRDRPKLEFSVERDRKALEDVLQIKVESSDAPLLQETVRQKADKLRNEADQALASVRQDEEIDRLIAEVGQRRAEWSIAEAFIEELDEAVEQTEAKVNNSQPPPARVKNPLRETLNGMGPFPGYCSHLMTKAWNEGCPIAHERPADDEIVKVTDEIAAEALPEAARLASMKSELARRKEKYAPLQVALTTAVGALTLARERHQRELDKLKAPGLEAAKVEALLASYQKATGDLEAWDKDLSGLKTAKDELDVKLGALVDHHRAVIKHFSRIFNHIAQTMLGDAVTGSVRIKGKALSPEIEYHGPRDSAALKVVRWLIFDLAALALGMTNEAAHHPRILIHDSSREADLAAPIYVSLFTAARELEGNSPLAAFQYIVTTTEPSSDALNQKPWLLDPVLDASIKEGRLLGVDI